MFINRYELAKCICQIPSELGIWCLSPKLPYTTIVDVNHCHDNALWPKTFSNILKHFHTSEKMTSLRVPPGVYFDVLRQSHCPLINKEPVCVRPPEPYIGRQRRPP